MDLAAKPTATLASPDVTPASPREQLGTVLCGLWMTIGLFLDGYFHQNLDGDGESFVTPWHAVFYAGFTAAALWLAAMSSRRAPVTADWRLAHLPAGYDGARLGLVLFALGGLGDALWHGAFGVERGIDALLSPTHLLLFAALLLILTTPFRTERAVQERPVGWIVAGSVISATALVGFFLNFAWGLGIAAQTRISYDPLTDAGEAAVIAGVTSMLVTTVVLFVAVRVLLAAGAPPPGAITALFALTATLVSGAFDEDAEGIVAALIAGAVLDAVIRRDLIRLTLAFGLAATVLWVGYLGLLQAIDGIEWPAEIWLGAAVLSSACAAVIATISPSGHLVATRGQP